MILKKNKLAQKNLTNPKAKYFKLIFKSKNEIYDLIRKICFICKFS